jgi:hypothetical protein
MLLLTFIMALLYKLRELLIKDNYFLLFNDSFKVICNVFIKHKSSFKTLYKDLK